MEICSHWAIRGQAASHIQSEINQDLHTKPLIDSSWFSAAKVEGT